MHTFTHHLLSKNHSTITVAIHEKVVYDFCNWCEDENVEAKKSTYGDVLLYVKSLQKRGLKQRTIQMQLSSLSHYFKWLVDVGVRQDVPTEGIETKGVQRTFLYHIIPMMELERVYEQIQGSEAYLSGSYQVWEKQSHYSRKNNKIIFGLMIWQGLGAGEINRLTVQDVKLREGKIYIAGDRRSNERTIKLQSVQILDFMEYLQHIRPYFLLNHKTPTESLFVTLNQGATHKNRMAGVMKLVQSIHPQITSTNQLRASVITHWLKNNNLRETQYMAGHRYVSSTESYLINDMEDLLEDIGKFHPMG